MDEEDLFDEKIKEFFEKDALRAKINRTYLSLEIRITIDHLLNHTGARLVSQQGRAIDVHPETIKYYFKLSSLIYNYTFIYGKNQELEALKEKWATTARRAYFESG